MGLRQNEARKGNKGGRISQRKLFFCSQDENERAICAYKRDTGAIIPKRVTTPPTHMHRKKKDLKDGLRLT